MYQIINGEISYEIKDINSIKTTYIIKFQY
jgi:hypothetical protein